MLAATGSIEHIELSNTLNDKLFFKNYILQTV